jgi:hypothetical protein
MKEYLAAPSSMYAAPPRNLVSRAESVVAEMHDFLAFFAFAIGAAICIAIVTAGIVHLIRPLARKVNQRFAVRAWVTGRVQAIEGRPEIPAWLGLHLTDREQVNSRLRSIFEKSFDKMKQGLLESSALGSSVLPDELFMHAIQAEAKAAVARPLGNPALFYALMANAPADVRWSLAALDLIFEDDPEAAAALTDFEATPPAQPTLTSLDAPGAEQHEPSDALPVERSDGRALPPERALNPIAAAFSHAQNVAATAVDRALDELQLDLVARSIRLDRILSVSIGILLGALASVALDLRFAGVFIAVSAVGGILSLILLDVSAAVYSNRKR